MTDHDILIGIASDLRNTRDRLYGENGDIPKILNHLEKINGTQVKYHGRISRLEMALKIGGGCGGVGIIAVIIMKILGIY